MTDYIETQTEDGVTIRIEVDSAPVDGAGFGRQAGSGKAEAASDVYSQTLNTVRACADGMIDTLQNLEALPSAASIDFAIKVDAKAGAMISKSMSEGQFKVSLSWKQVEPEAEEEQK